MLLRMELLWLSTVEDYSCYFTLDLQHTCWSFIDIHLHLQIQGKTQK